MLFLCHLTGHGNSSSEFLDDPVTDGKPQAGAFARGFGGEERIENLYSDFLGEYQCPYRYTLIGQAGFSC